MCQMDLMWVSSDTSIQSVPSVVYVSDCPGSLSTGTQASSGKSGPALTDARGLRESALEADKSSRSSGAGPSSSSKHQTLTPGAGSRSSSEPRAPTDGARSGTSASGRKAVAGKVNVAGAWVHAAEFQKPLASRPTAKPTGISEKKVGGDRQAKGQDDPVKNF